MAIESTPDEIGMCLSARYNRAMRPVVLVVATALSAAALSAAVQAPETDASFVLARARQALGGDAALHAVASVDVKGTLARTMGSASFEESVEYALVLPERFVRVTESTSNLGPLGSAYHRRRTGFAGGDPIDEDESDSPLPPPTVAKKAAMTAQEIADQRDNALAAQRHTFANFVLPLLAASPASHPLTFTLVGQVAGPTGPADAIDATGPDGFVRHLFVDTQSHLIVGISWMAKPLVVVSATSSAIVSSPSSSSGGARAVSVPPPPVLPANPAGNLAEVQWQLTVGDYRAASGLNWPHRLTTTFGGRKYEDVKLGTYRVNSKVDPGLFRAAKS